MIKYLLIFFPFITLSQMNHLEYAQECEKGYSYFVEQKFDSVILYFEKINEKTPLLAKELQYMAISQSILGNDENVFSLLKKSLNTYAINPDFSVIHPFGFNLYEYCGMTSLQITELNNERNNLLATLSKEQMQLDSLIVDMASNDQKIREEILHLKEINDTIHLKEAENRMNVIDSTNLVTLLELIEKYGFVGQKRIPSYADAELLLLHQTSQEVFDKINEKLLVALKQGYISPNSYAMWVDRTLFLQGSTTKYGAYFGDTDLTIEELKANRFKIGLSNYSYDAPGVD